MAEALDSLKQRARRAVLGYACVAGVAMNEREAYARVAPVRRIVDAYAAVTPWGGAHLVAEGESELEVSFEVAQTIVDFLVDGKSVTEVSAGGRKGAVTFERRDWFLAAPSWQQFDINQRKRSRIRGARPDKSARNRFT